MVEGWHAFESQTRFVVFLGYIFTLATLGVYVGWRAQEEKGHEPS